MFAALGEQGWTGSRPRLTYYTVGRLRAFNCNWSDRLRNDRPIKVAGTVLACLPKAANMARIRAWRRATYSSRQRRPVQGLVTSSNKNTTNEVWVECEPAGPVGESIN